MLFASAPAASTLRPFRPRDRITASDWWASHPVTRTSIWLSSPTPERLHRLHQVLQLGSAHRRLAGQWEKSVPERFRHREAASGKVLQAIDVKRSAAPLGRASCRERV